MNKWLISDDDIETLKQMGVSAGRAIYTSCNVLRFCIVCGEHKDLRMGHCFDCADNAKGPDDVCLLGGLGKHNPDNEFCIIICKYSMKCQRRKGK